LDIGNWKLEIGNLELRIPHGACPRMTLSGAFRNSRGFSYIALLVAIVIIGISLGAAGKYWQNVALREKEEELIFRGNQYRQAIMQYYTAIPGRRQFPPNIDELLKDSRTTGKRYLRQKYKDPITGEDFEIVTSQTTSAAAAIAALRLTAVPGIIGVYSKSEKEPLKKDNFPPPLADFAGKTKYSEWLFVAFTGTVQQPIPGQPGAVPPQIPGQPGAVPPQIPGQPGFIPPQIPDQPGFVPPQIPGQPEDLIDQPQGSPPGSPMRPRIPRRSHGG
jgi:type II secretory pathway pseudopilin PulG